MPHNIYNAAQFLQYLTLSAVGTGLSAASLVTQVSPTAPTSIAAQLNVPHAFMYLQVPLWWFFVASVLLAFVGAFWSLNSDTLKGKGSTVGKLLTAATVGLIATFLVLPAVNDTPNVVAMMLIALGGGYSGTVLLYLAARLVNNKSLHDALIDVISDKIVAIIKFLMSLIPSGSNKNKDD